MSIKKKIAGIFLSGALSLNQGCGLENLAGSYSVTLPIPFFPVTIQGPLELSCAPIGFAPKRGNYLITYENGDTEQAIVKDNNLSFSRGKFPISFGTFRKSDTNIEGDPCTDCHCPQSGSRMCGSFTAPSSFRGNIKYVNYCRVSSQESFEGELVAE